MNEVSRALRAEADLAHDFVRRAEVYAFATDAVTQLQTALDPGADLAAVLLFISGKADFDAIYSEACTAFAPCPVIACTTAGEIGETGYVEDTIIALGLPHRHFAVDVVVFDTLCGDALARDVDALIERRITLAAQHPDKPNGFAFLAIDGLSLREDVVAAAIAPALGPVPLFGGSAGDGTSFLRALVAGNGAVHEKAAVLVLIQTDFRAEVFTLDHLNPTGTRMVVTSADPEARIVKEINAEPAAAEYARIVGKDPGQLDEFTFAAHPVVVRIGERYHVRSIQRMNPEGELVFFSAIDEGMVLTTALPEPMAPHLDKSLTEIIGPSTPAMILACDCLLRRMEAEQTQEFRAVSDILSDHNVTGFSTYGEQIGPIHVNQTMTGVVLFPPDE